MVHAVRIRKGKASYANHWVQTSRLRQELRARRRLFTLARSTRLPLQRLMHRNPNRCSAALSYRRQALHETCWPVICVFAADLTFGGGYRSCGVTATHHVVSAAFQDFPCNSCGIVHALERMQCKPARRGGRR